MGIINKRWMGIVIISSVALLFSGMNGLNNKALATPVTPEVSGGDGYSLSLANDGTVWGWGNNSSGTLGDGTNTDSLKPIKVTGLLAGKSVSAISTRYLHSLAIADSAVYSWGINSSGQLGDGTITDRKTPVKVGGLTGKTISKIAAGMAHSLALTSTGTLYAWGNNDNGQLGDGTNITRSTPVLVSGLAGKTIIAIAAGNFHTVAVASDGSVWAWGNNSFGQLGDGSFTNRSIPVRVIGLSGKVVSKVAAGYYHTLAQVTDGTVWASGNNAAGQLGDGTTTNRSTSVKVSGLTGKTIIDIAAANDHSLALVNDRTMMSWGENDQSQLGDGTTLNRSTPVVISALAGKLIYDISSGVHHSLVTDDNGVVWTWGGNTSGELGDGTTAASLNAVHSLADVARDKAVLALDYEDGDTAAKVTENITLPTAGANGTTISWMSNDGAVVISPGLATVTRDADADTDVILTATISNGSISDTLAFPIKVLQTDNGAIAAAKVALEIDYAIGDAIGSVTKNIHLTTTGTNGTTISWSSFNSAISVLGTAGVVTRPVSPAGNAVGILTATITRSDGTPDTKDFSLTVTQQSDADAVAEAEDALEIGYTGVETAANVVSNVTLAASGLNGTTITWESNHTEIIKDSTDPANKGKVTRPADADTVVDLEATLSKNGTEVTKNFPVTVLQSPAGAIAQTKVSVTLITYGGADTASSITQSLILKTSDTNGTTISWASNNQTVISNAGVVTRPVSANVNVTLTATIQKAGATSAVLPIVLTVIQTDAGTVPAAKAALAITYATGDSDKKVTRDLTLPSTGVNGAVIDWTSGTPAVISNSGVVTSPTDADVSVVMTAQITKNAVVDSKTFTLKVFQTDASAVAAAKAALAIVYGTGDNTGDLVGKATKKMTLPTTGTNGTTISWLSDTPAVISSAGVVTRKADEDAAVTLTATILKTSIPSTPITETKIFNITVPQSEIGAINEAKAALTIGYGGDNSAAKVTENITLPSVGLNTTTITWTSGVAATISAGGVVVRPKTADKTVVLTATLRKGTSVSTKAFTLIAPQTEDTVLASASSALALIFTKGDNKASVTSKITLPATGIKGTTITWDNNGATALSANGDVTRQANANTAVTLAATITKSGVTLVKQFPVTVLQTDVGAVETSRAALEASGPTYSAGEDEDTVKGKLILPTKGANGVTITWDSSLPKIISKAGAVVRQPNADSTVVLTAKIKKSNVIDSSLVFTLKVLQSDAGAVAAAKLALDIGYNGGDTIGNVRNNLTLSNSGLNGTAVTWTSNNETVISSPGGVTRLTTKDTKVTLTAAIKKNTTIVKKSFILTVPQTDAGATKAASTLLAIGYGKGDKAANVTQDMTLPLTAGNGAVITWSSSNNAVVSDSGVVTRQANADTSLEMTATLTKNGGGTESKIFPIIVPQTDAGSIAAAETALTIGYSNNETAASVTQKLSLIKIGASNTTIVWTSDSSAISVSGVVTRQASGDKTVTLHATIKKNALTGTKSFVLTVPQSDIGAINLDKAALVIGYAGGDSANYVTQNLTLDSSGDSGTTITWASSVPAVVSASGEVTPVPAKKTAVRLTATITKNGATTTKVFTLSV